MTILQPRRPAILPARLYPAGLRHEDLYSCIREIDPGSLVAYWPLDETQNTLARDHSGHGFNGIHTGVDLGRPGVGDGRTAPFYDGSNDYTNVYSAALAAAFNGAEGTLLCWARVANAGVWTDGVAHNLIELRADASNRIFMSKPVSNIIRANYRAGGVDAQRDVTVSTPTWICWVLTWNLARNAARVYWNAVQQGATLTGLGTWAGALLSTNCCIGASSTTPTAVHHGTIAHVALWSRALPPEAMRAIWAASGLEGRP